MTGVDALVRMLPSLAVIVGALLLLRHWAQRGRSTSTTPLRVISRTGITKGSVVAVVEVGDRRLLVGAAEQGVSLLAELDPGTGMEAASDPAHETPAEAASAPAHDPAHTTTAAAAPATDRQRLLEQLRHTSLTGPRTTTDDRPRMAPIDRLRHLTVRTPVASPPPRPTRATPRP